MPYVFPYETLFIWIISLLIVGLLGLRVVVTLRRRQHGKGEEQSIQEP
jgi:cytochrome c-type biogenesis protein CcmH/NrfF